MTIPHASATDGFMQTVVRMNVVDRRKLGGAIPRFQTIISFLVGGLVAIFGIFLLILGFDYHPN